MNEIDRWFERTALRNSRPVSMYGCLLTGRILSYFGYRLRYPFLIATVRFAVHVAEFFILLSTLGGVAAFTVMVLRAGSLIVAGGWWGLLEVMRERLRVFARSGQRDGSESEIGRWLVLSVCLGVIVIAAGGAVVFALSPPGGDPVARLYAMLIVIELAIDFPVRVLHSGIYATRRVYKPIWSMFVPIVTQLAILGLGFYLYPAAAIIISIVVSNAIGIWITVHYCLEVYRLMGLWPRYPGPGIPRPWQPGPRAGVAGHRIWRYLPTIPPRLGFETTLSGLSLRLDAILVLALVGFYGTNTRAFDLTAGLTSWQQIDAFQFFYLVIPLFRGTYDSAGIFYFDLVRLRSAPALRELQRYFFHTLLWVAPMIALFFWSLAAALGIVVLRDVPISFLLAVSPLFALRSLIGAYQIRLFADGRFGTHIATLALLVALLTLAWADPNPAGDLLQITAAMIVQLIVLMNLQHFRDRREPPLPVLVPLRNWTTLLAAEPGPAAVGRFTVPKSSLPAQKTAVVSLMRRHFDGTGYFAFLSSTTLIYYTRVCSADTPLSQCLALQEMTGCTASRGEALPGPATDGPEALDRLVARGWVAPNAAGHRAASVTALIRDFQTLFPDGVAFDTRTRAGAKDMRTLDETVLATALPEVIAGFADGTDAVPVSERWLTPVFTGATLRLVCALPPDPEPARFREWLDILRSWNHDIPTRPRVAVDA